MYTAEALYHQMKSENDLLQMQLKDLEYMIQLREEELEEMKNTAKQVSVLHSKLDNNLIQFEHMQNIIGDQDQKAVGAERRENAMEEEMLQSITAEQAYYEINSAHQSLKLALEDTQIQLSEAILLYKERTDLQKKIAELESNLEMALLDNQFLKEDLAALREKENKVDIIDDHLNITT
jgi:hypothetical protein